MRVFKVVRTNRVEAIKRLTADGSEPIALGSLAEQFANYEYVNGDIAQKAIRIDDWRQNTERKTTTVPAHIIERRLAPSLPPPPT